MDEYEEQSEVAEKYNIRVVPLFHFYKDEELVESFPTRDKAKIVDAIYKHIGKSEIIEEWSDLTGSK
jgi:ribosome-binding factor A